jgi:GAF domain-containing protein
VIDVIEGDGQVRRVVVGHADPAKASVADRLRNIRLDRQRPHLLYEPLVHGQAVLCSRLDEDELRERAQGPEHLEVLLALEARSMIAVPLETGGHLLGAFAMLSASDARYGEDDARFAEELARVIALAMDNARLHETASRAIAARDEVLGIVAHDLRSCSTPSAWRTVRSRRP